MRLAFEGGGVSVKDFGGDTLFVGTQRHAGDLCLTMSARADVFVQREDVDDIVAIMQFFRDLGRLPTSGRELRFRRPVSSEGPTCEGSVEEVGCD